MKRLLILLPLLFYSFLSFSQTDEQKKIIFDWWVNGGAEQEPQAIAYGQLFNDSFSNFNRWTSNGTISVGSGQISNGASTGLNYIYDNFSSFGGEKFKVIGTLTVNTAGAGVAVGISNEHHTITDASRKRSIWGVINTSTGALSIVRRKTSTNTSLATVTISAPAIGNSITLTLERYHNTYHLVYRNNTSGLTSAIAAIEDLTEGNSVGNFTIVNLGGTYTPTSYAASTNCATNALVTIGNSITHGFGATSIYNRWSNLLVKNSETPLEVWAGNGAQTTGSVTSLPYLKLLTPRKVLMMIGGNDTEDVNVTPTTLHNTYEQIRNELTLVGARVYHCRPTPRQGETALANFDTWLTTTTNLGSDVIINTRTPLQTVGGILRPEYDSGDGRHPNDAGYALISSIILSAAPNIVTPSNRSEVVCRVLYHIPTLSLLEKQLVAAFVDDISAQGYLSLVKSVQIFGLSGDNALYDLFGIIKGLDVNSPTSSRTGKLYNGTNQITANGGWMFGFSGNLVAAHWYVHDMITASGTSALGGASDGSNLIHLSQVVGTNITYRVCQGSGNATTYTGQSAFLDDKVYSIGRSGANAPYLVEDQVVLQTGTQATNPGVPLRSFFTGAFNSNGSPSSFCNYRCGAFALTENLGANRAHFAAALKTFVTGVAALTAF